MSYFNQDFIDFFKDLQTNNNKEWFDANRKRYESSIKKPFTKFVDEMIGRINAEDPEVRIEAKDAVMRINRDIRFSPDKTPYNTHVGAIISTTGRKDKSVPGFFMRFSTEGINLFGGAHGVDKDQLQKIRTAIAADLKGFKKLLQEESFQKTYGGLLGEKNKRVPKEFEEMVTLEPLIANKAFYYRADLPLQAILKDDLPEKLMEYWHIARPVKDFLTKALQ